MAQLAPRRPRLLLRLAAPAAAAALAYPGAAAPGTAWTLRSLGYGDQAFPATGKSVAARSVLFRLPPGARQGRGAWYLIRLHFRLVIDPGSGSGRIYIVGSTNGRPAAMITFTVTRTRAGLRVESNEFGLAGGSRIVSGPSLDREIRFENYLQVAGVRGGENVLTLGVEQESVARFRTLTFYADSGIELSPLGPASLSVQPFLRHATIEVGEPFEVEFHVRNRGRRPATGARVRALPGRGVRVRGPVTRALAPIGPGQEAHGAFTLEAERAGRLDATIAVESAFGSPATRFELDVRRAAGSGFPWPAAAGGGGALAALVTAVLIVRRRMGRSAY